MILESCIVERHGSGEAESREAQCQGLELRKSRGGSLDEKVIQMKNAVASTCRMKAKRLSQQ